MLIEEIVDCSERVLAARLYYPYVLLVHPDVRHLHATAEQVAQQAGWQKLAVSRELCSALVKQPVTQRTTAASTVLDKVVIGLRPGPILCTDLPLLFEPSLELDALGLLRQWSRRVPLVAAWPGTFDDQGLAYAVPDHAHYHLWPHRQLDDLRSYIVL